MQLVNLTYNVYSPNTTDFPTTDGMFVSWVANIVEVPNAITQMAIMYMVQVKDTLHTQVIG